MRTPDQSFRTDDPDDDFETGRSIDRQLARGDTLNRIAVELGVGVHTARAEHRRYCEHRDRVAAEMQIALF